MPHIASLPLDNAVCIENTAPLMGLLADMGVSRRIIESLAVLTGVRPLTVRQLAEREGVTVIAIRQRRRRLELQLGRRMPRYETRGRKPAPLPPLLGASGNDDLPAGAFSTLR